MKAHHLVISAALLFSANLYADNKVLETAVGAGIGAAIGNEVGGRDGAIVGGVVGAVVGASVGDDSKPAAPRPAPSMHYEVHQERSAHPDAQHCPPGQAKKGRC